MPQKKPEPTDAHIEEAGHGSLDEEVLPNEGDPVAQEDTGGNDYDTAGKHGDMAPETAGENEEIAEKSGRIKEE